MSNIVSAISLGHDIVVVGKRRIGIVERGMRRMAAGRGIAVGEELRIVLAVEEGMDRMAAGWGIVVVVDTHHIAIVEGDVDRMVAVEDHYIEPVVVHSIVARWIRTADKGSVVGDSSLAKLRQTFHRRISFQELWLA
jgi:hypothetical protein